eukprot:457360-Amphidinium_carterae.1
MASEVMNSCGMSWMFIFWPSILASINARRVSSVEVFLPKHLPVSDTQVLTCTGCIALWRSLTHAVMTARSPRWKGAKDP